MKRRPIGVRKVDNTRRDHTPIAVEFENCVQSFNSLCSAMEANQLAWEAKYALIRECRGEFRAWGDDTGALKGSLDHALRKNSRMRDVTIELLEDMTGEVRSSRSFPAFLRIVRNYLSRPLLRNWAPSLSASNLTCGHSARSCPDDSIASSQPSCSP